MARVRRDRRVRRVVGAALLLTAIATLWRGSVALAQNPAAARPVGGALAGVVRDVSGAPLPDVSVTLLGEATETRTDTAGRFALRDVPPGGHTALFRRLGYRSVEYRWAARAGGELQLAVAMTPLPRELDRVVVEAPASSRRRGTSSIGGSVSDSAGAPLPGADVRLLGSGLSTITDSSGRFEFQKLAAGAYVVRARREGRRGATYVMQIADDDHRSISLKLFGLPRTTSASNAGAASGYGVADIAFDAFDRRERTPQGAIVLGPGDLFRANRTPLDVLLQPYRQPSVSRVRRSSIEGIGSSDEGDCLFIDGRRAVYQPLGSFTSQDVQLVEVLPPTALAEELVLSRMDAVRECRGSIDHHPPYFVLWTRSLR